MRVFPLHFSRPARSNSGAALIIVLTFVVLLTVLILAFLGHSQISTQVMNARAAEAQVDVMARAVIELTKGDLRQEIVSGSRKDGSPSGAVYTVNGKRIYVPTSRFTAAPSVTGFTMGTVGSDPLANVLKINRSDAAFFSANRTGQGESSSDYDTSDYPSPAPSLGTSWATAVDTSQPSINGRYLDWSAWEKSQLIDTTKGTPSATGLPQWTYLTTTGRKVLTQPDGTVIGRYSFIMYDEGGLLDINNAGYPTSTSFAATVAVSALDAARKGPLALADLTQLPGITSYAMQDSIVGWRNQATTSVNAPTIFPATNYAFPTNSAPPYLQYAFNSSFNRGNTLIYPQDASTSNPGDQKFLSRQDLIAYSAANPTKLPAATLPYLGTFTRANNAPSYTPTQTINSPLNCNYDYAGNAEVTTQSATAPYVVNRDIANVRWQNTVTVTRPVLDDDTGTKTETVTFNKGDPLLQHRFPLSKFQLLANPTPANAAAILYYFGLVWYPAGNTALPAYANGYNAARTESHWEYAHATTNGTGRYNAVAGQAKYPNSLQEVAAFTGTNAREPDFFELVQAGILNGSCGYSMVYGIGTSILAQAVPETTVSLVSLTSTAGSAQIFFGPKNLPYISQLLYWPYRPDPGAPTDPNHYRDIFEAYLVPVLWNPHRNAASASTVVRNLQISLAASRGATFTAALQPFSAYFDPTFQTQPGLTDQSPPAPITFNNANVFSEPTILNPSSVTITSAAPTGSLALTEKPTASTTRWGFFLGSTVLCDTTLAAQLHQSPLPAVPTNAENVTTWPGGTTISNMQKTNAGASLTFAMQWVDATGAAHTYEYADTPGVGTGDTAGANINGTVDTATTSFSGSTGGTSDGYDFFGHYSTGALDPRVSISNAVAKMNGRLASNTWNTTLAGTNKIPTGATWRSSTTLVQSSVAGSLTTGYSGSVLFGQPTAVASPVYPAQWCENAAVSSETLQYSDNAYINTITSGVNAGNSGDGVIRSGDAYRVGAPGLGVSYPLAANQVDDRPVVLNRLFRNVGELGYAFRALEWKTIDFSSPNSSDAGLLDLFSVQSRPVVNGVSLVSGVVDINTRNPEVLQSLLAGELINDVDTSAASVITPTQAKTIANSVVTETTTNGPLLNRADIATRLAPLTSVPWTRKTERESVVRALAESSETRTWNLLIDLVVQAGRYPTSVVNGSASDLPKFDVQGEKRYWLHVAIDRYTGQVIDEQLEAVTDN